ncbi:MAG: aryl-sulfate sulfotransferase [Myxococcota bacterium]
MSRTVPALLIALAVTGCRPGSACIGKCDEASTPATDPSTAPTTPTVPTGPATSTSEVPTVSVCDPSDTLSVLDVTPIDGPIATDRALQVRLSEPATVAALCTLDAEPGERHLVVSDVSATDHELRFQGLLPDGAYTCQVAPTCPTMVGTPATVTVTAGSAPPLPTLEVEVDPTLGMTGYWTLLTFVNGACSANGRYIALYDPMGVARWWYALPDSLWIDVEALYDPDDHTIVWGGGEGPDGRARIVDLWEGEQYATAWPGWEDDDFSHDAKRLPDGRLLTLQYEPNSAGGPQFIGFRVRVHDPDALSIDVDLPSQRYVDEGVLEPGDASPLGNDPYHANWVDLEEQAGEDRLFVSLCFDWSILSLDPATGDVRYRLARDEGWTVLDESGAEIGEDALPQCTHGDEVTGDDTLLVYDNGQGRGYSQIAEWAVDPQTRTAQRLYQWDEPGWHETTLGDVDVLAGDRLLVTEAHADCWSPIGVDFSQIVEVDRATGAVASRMTFPAQGDTTYRAERYGGCEMMSSVRACPALGELADALAPAVGW